MKDQKYSPAEPSEPCSISVDVPIIEGEVAGVAAQAALDEALKTEAGERFKKGDCRELIVLFHSVGPHH